MSSIKFTMRELLEAGVHFGHKTYRWNPKMAPFIYGSRNGLHIIDLQKTYPLLKRALKAVEDVASKNGRILFVGTKRNASNLVAEYAAKCGQYYVNHRWLGGMMTNWKTVSQSIKTMKDLNEILEIQSSSYTKKELLMLARKRDKLEKSLGGIKEMGGVPDMIVVIDRNRDNICVDEARRIGIPIVGVLDTNSNPEDIDYPIPGNDDAIKSIDLYCRLISDAALAGMGRALGGSNSDNDGEMEAKIAEAESIEENGKENVEDNNVENSLEGNSLENTTEELVEKAEDSK